MNQKYCSSWLLIILILILLVVSAVIVALCTGSADIAPKKILSILLKGEGNSDYSILTGIRLPRIILGLSIGGALSLAGVLLQGMFKNPLMEPYTLGISGGASLGVCVNIFFRLHEYLGIIAYPLSGFAGASIVIFLIWGLNQESWKLRSNRMLLTGVMISYVSSSLVTLLMALSKTQELQNIIMWIMGSLDEYNPILIRLSFFFSVAGLVVSYFFCLDLNALLLGDEEAANLGVNTARTKKWLFMIASFLTGLSVSIAGVIMFVGLIVPHFMRLITGPDHRILLISSFLGGGAFLVYSDVIARTIISPLELPVGVITGIIGGVVFIWAISRRSLNL